MFHRFSSCGLAVAMLLFLAVHAQAGAKPILVSLTVDPAISKEGEEKQAALKTSVKLQAPSPGYFICEVRSEDRRKLDCSSIIFKKGDVEGEGSATIHWARIPAEATLKLTAYNVDAPDATVSFTVTLKKKDAESP